MAGFLFSWAVLAVAFYWLLKETRWLRVRLVAYLRVATIDLSAVLMMGIGMVFLAVGFIMLPNYSQIKVTIIGSDGKEYKGFTLGQARKICKKASSFRWRFEPVTLKSPQGNSYLIPDGFLASRIVRKRDGWSYAFAGNETVGGFNTGVAPFRTTNQK